MKVTSIRISLLSFTAELAFRFIDFRFCGALTFGGLEAVFHAVYKLITITNYENGICTIFGDGVSSTERLIQESWRYWQGESIDMVGRITTFCEYWVDTAHYQVALPGFCVHLDTCLSGIYEICY